MSPLAMVIAPFCVTSPAGAARQSHPADGASGGGKTTVLRLIGGQIKAQQGQVLFDGKDVGQMQNAQLYAMRRRMGMLFQFGALFTDMSVLDNVAFPLREHTRLPESMVRDIVLMKLHAVGLRGARDLMPSQISGGMARGWRWPARLRWTRSSSCTTSPLRAWIPSHWARLRA